MRRMYRLFSNVSLMTCETSSIMTTYQELFLFSYESNVLVLASCDSGNAAIPSSHMKLIKTMLTLMQCYFRLLNYFRCINAFLNASQLSLPFLPYRKFLFLLLKYFPYKVNLLPSSVFCLVVVCWVFELLLVLLIRLLTLVLSCDAQQVPAVIDVYRVDIRRMKLIKCT
jgi:hypothetical protein